MRQVVDRKMRWIAAPLVLSAAYSTGVAAEPVTYVDETVFLEALQALGYAVNHEGFEDDAGWGAVRSSIVDGQHSQPVIHHQGLAWAANNLSSEVTTGGGPARTGNWGFYTLPHGSYGDPDPGTDCFVPGDCGDGWRVTGAEPLVAFGGWVDTNTPFAKLGVYLDAYPAGEVDFGETCDPPESENCSPNDVVTNVHQFWGVIDEAGFEWIEFRELEGKLEIGGGDLKYIFADDFWFAWSLPDLLFRSDFEVPGP
jgi:hypothetical protein